MAVAGRNSINVTMLSIDETLLGVAQADSLLQEAPQHRLKVERRAAQSPEYLGRGGLLLQRLIAFAGEPRFCVLVRDRRPPTPHGLWRTAPLRRSRFAASRFSGLAACSEAPSHRLPRASGQGIVAGQISTLEVARHALKYGMFAAIAPAASPRSPQSVAPHPS